MPHRFDAVLDTCRRAAGVAADITWVDERWLLEEKVAPWMELPLWLPAGAGHDGLSAVECPERSSAGLTFRSLAETCSDTLAWDRTRAGVGMDAQLSAEREAELAAAWKAR